jgi:hypothetical protein
LIGRYILEPFCTYEKDAVHSIARLAQGSPFWCHFLARGVLQAKIDSAGGWSSFRNSSVPANVTEDDVQRLVGSLAELANCQLYETALSQTVMGDDTNKRVLQIIAAQPDTMISTAGLRSAFAQNNIDAKIGQETVEGFLTLPGVLEEHGRIRDVIQFAFQDPNFRRYILLRSGLA